jgi:tryptophan halogenase
VNYKTDNIVIVGGGSAGWITAATLIAKFPNKNITVVESSLIPTIGVGESTIPEILEWLKVLGINYNDFLKEVNGTFKAGIGFTNFLREDSGTFFYPFGYPDFYETENRSIDWKRKKIIYPETPYGDYVEYYYPFAHSFKTNKIVDKQSDKFNFLNPLLDYAFQVDAQLFAKWLAEKYCIPRGVNRIIATVDLVNENEHGVTSLSLSDGSLISGDIFVDCSGFKSLLLGKTMKAGFVDTKEFLPNNSAWAGPAEYYDKNTEMEVYTNCTALKNGWAWNTPLWSRIGTGYVYDNNFINDEDALQEFKDYLDSPSMKFFNPNRSKDMDFRKIEIKNGYYKENWIKNVVATGLSAGFLEPLESTGLALIHYSSMQIVRTMQRKVITQYDIDLFNKQVRNKFEDSFKFVATHFSMSQRDDSEYWSNITSKKYSKDIVDHKDKLMGGYAECIPVGFEFLNYSLLDFNNDELYMHLDLKLYMNSFFEKRNKKIQDWKDVLDKSPTHYEFLRDNIYI